MNPQELFIDVSSGRFLDGESNIPVSNPSFFSDETKTLKLNVKRVKNNRVSDFSPSADSRYKIRLGTASLKLADGVDVSTAGPTLFTAQATVVTKSPQQIIFEGLAVTFSPVTASLEPVLNTTAGVTALVVAEVYQPTLVTAAVTLSYVSGTVTTSSTKIQAENLINFNPEGSWDRSQVPLIIPMQGSAGGSRFVLDLTAILNTGSAASASAVFNLNSANLQAVSITNRGSGYFGDSAVAVVSGGRNPIQATFAITVSGGSVTSISIVCAGAGYPAGAYDIRFNPSKFGTMPSAVATAANGSISEVAINNDGGGEYNFPSAQALLNAPSSVTATISAVVCNGFVTSVTITNAGSGYTSNPTIVFESPRGGIREIAPTNAIGSKVNGRQRFLWVYGLDTTETIPPTPINFSLPPQSIDDSVQTSVPSAFLHFVKDDPRGNIWEIQLVSPGYGYTTPPVVTHDPTLCSTSRLFIAPYHKKSKSNPLNSPVLGATTPGFYDGDYVTQNKNETKFFGLFIDRTKRSVIRYGGCAVDYATYAPSNYFRTDGTGIFQFDAYGSVIAQNNLEWSRMKHSEISFQDYSDAYFNGLRLNGSQVPTTTISYVGELSEARTLVDYSQADVFMRRDISNPDLRIGLFSRGNTEQFKAWTDGCFFTDIIFPRHEFLVNNTGKPRSFIYGRGGVYPYQVFYQTGGTYDAKPIAEEFDFGKFTQGLAGTSGFLPYGRRKKGISTARLGKYRMTFPPVNYNYKVHFVAYNRSSVGYLTQVNSEYTKVINSIYRDFRAAFCSVYGGGQFETFWEVEDYGNDLVQDIGGDINAVADYPAAKDGAGFYGYKTNKPFFISKTPDVVITTPTPARIYGSYAPTVASRVVANGIEWYFSDGGLGVGDSFSEYSEGYLGNKTPSTTVITASVVSASSGYIGSARLTNVPRGYLDGVYNCAVLAPASGTTAAVDLVINRGVSSVVLQNRGSGYTSAPAVTAPSPNETGGYLYKVKITNAPVGYSANSTFDCEVGDSTEIGGTARITLQSDDQGLLTPEIANAGFGYTSSPVVTAPGFSENEIGKVTGIICTNTPVGYIPDKLYELEIQAPASGIRSLASVRFDENGVMTSFVDISGFGYTSKPVITAPGPDREQGFIGGGVVLSSGLGYAVGSYPAIVDDPPAGGVRATANAIINNQGQLPTLEIISGGSGYVTKPRITVLTPAGSVVSGITITCAGNFYINDTVNFEFTDSTGAGVEFAPPLVQSGKIINLPVIYGGQNYTAPQIRFSPPTAPEIEAVPQNQVRQTVDITTASAGAILGNNTERNIFFELYETDGTNEQVVVQGTAVLKKRVQE